MEGADLLRYGWNTAAWGVTVAAVVGLVSPRSRPLRQGWRSKVLWVMALAPAITVDGAWLYVPIGPPAVLWQLRKGWRSVEARRRTEASLPARPS
jgi:hypothetical protein